ncbi:hypothetical protein H0H93_012859 [Arthromyces matolae]|nr:hypothetical protein H0H93_012859 [Arthromyces matolae]
MMMPRPGYVFAEHYYTLDHFKDPEYQPNELKAVKLERDGSLDLKKVKDAFKVRFGEGSTFGSRKGSCIPVDPVRWKFFESKEVDKLSALAVKTLSEREGHIAFVEFRTNDEYLAALRARKTKHEEDRDVIDEDISRLTEIRIRYNN